MRFELLSEKNFKRLMEGYPLDYSQRGNFLEVLDV